LPDTSVAAGMGQYNTASNTSAQLQEIDALNLKAVKNYQNLNKSIIGKRRRKFREGRRGV